MSILATFTIRLLLILLFLPFSALDKVLNFNQAVEQASQATRSRTLAKALIRVGFCIEVVMSLAVISGAADRFAAFILGIYCIVTALLWKQFWKSPDFRLRGPSHGRDVFWDFLKNLAVAGGFLLLSFGATADGIGTFLEDPFESTHPYG